MTSNDSVKPFRASASSWTLALFRVSSNAFIGSPLVSLAKWKKPTRRISIDEFYHHRLERTPPNRYTSRHVPLHRPPPPDGHHQGVPPRPRTCQILLPLYISLRSLNPTPMLYNCTHC